MDLLFAYGAGLLAAFTPCVVFLMPLIAYRFFHEEKKLYVQFGLFVGAFLLFYILFGYVLRNMFTSEVQNGFRIGFGILFVLLGVLALMNKLNPLNLPLAKNPLLLGVIFSLLVSFNPCTIPFFTLILSLHTQGAIISNLLFFAAGIITPSILFVLFGNSLLKLSHKSGSMIKKFGVFMNLILIIAGGFLLFSTHTINISDMYVVTAFLVLMFLLLLRSFFIVTSWKELGKPGNIILLIGFLLLLYVLLGQCTYHIENDVAVEALEYTCSEGSILNCPSCVQCISLFGMAALLGFVGVYLQYRFKNFK